MANIPVEKRSSGIPWWAWLLGALLLLALLFFLLFNGDDDDVVVDDPVEVVDDPVVVDEPDDDLAETAGEITTLAALDDAIAAGRAGEAVALSAVPVSALAGDSTFYVGTAPNRTLVVLEDLGESQSGPGTGADGAFNVDEGDTVSIRGTIRAFDPAARGTSSLADADRSEAEARRYVVVVDGRGGLDIE